MRAELLSTTSFWFNYRDDAIWGIQIKKYPLPTLFSI